MTWSEFASLTPIIWPALAAFVILVFGGAKDAQGRRRSLPPLSALAGLLAALFSLWIMWPEPESELILAGALRIDSLGLFLSGLAVCAGIATVLLSVDFLKRRDYNHPEYYVLVLFATVGMMIMGTSSHMLTLVLGLETMSIALYVLTGFFRSDSKSVEASIKYFLTGSFASAILIFGMALVYGGTASLDLAAIADHLNGSAGTPLVGLGLAFMIAGFAFKIAAAPFHMWLPDVYEGAPTTITGFMATGVKVAAFGALIRLFNIVYSVEFETLRETLWWIAVGTMSVGNLAALTQKSVKRMLAYSSIAHAGYLMVAIVVMRGQGFDDDGGMAVRGILYYLMAYTAATLGAFGVLSYLESENGQSTSFGDLAGLKKKQPFLAFSLAVFMFSLAGIPGTAGFIGKFLIFGASVEAGQAFQDESLVLLAILGILNSLIGLYYYLRVPIQLYAMPLGEDDRQSWQPAKTFPLVAVVFVALLATLWFGLGPEFMGQGVEPALQIVKSALESLG